MEEGELKVRLEAIKELLERDRIVIAYKQLLFVIEHLE